MMLEKIKFIYRAFRYRYKLDLGEINFIRQEVKEGTVAVDIGAHKGGYLYWLSKSAGSSGKVYAFEPQPSLFKYLQKSQHFLPYQNVFLENLGVSSTMGKFDFFIPGPIGNSSPGATLNMQKKQEEQGQAISIKTINLDRYFINKPNPQFLKIDVEGHEMEVFQGAKNILSDERPMLLFECEQRHQKKYKLANIFDFLFRFGYQGFFFRRNKLLPIGHFQAGIHQAQGNGEYWKAPNYCNNFIFVASSLNKI